MLDKLDYLITQVATASHLLDIAEGKWSEKAVANQRKDLADRKEKLDRAIEKIIDAYKALV